MASGGDDEGRQDRQRTRAGFGASAETAFSEDDQPAQGLFGMVVGRVNAVMVQEGEESMEFPFGIEQSGTKVFSAAEQTGTGADGLQGGKEACFEQGRLAAGNVGGCEPVGDRACELEESFDALTEAHRAPIAQVRVHEFELR